MSKVYPSQVRYYDKNPCITFRLKRDEKERIEHLAERAGKSISQLVKECLLDAEKLDSESYETGMDAGYTIAMDKWRIWYFCKICGKYIYVSPNSNSHEAIIKYMEQNGGGHSDCYKQNSQI